MELKNLKQQTRGARSKNQVVDVRRRHFVGGGEHVLGFEGWPGSKMFKAQQLGDLQSSMRVGNLKESG